MDPNKKFTDSGIEVNKLYSAEESNKHYHHLLEQGTMELSITFDRPTQLGHDSDHIMSEGKVGKAGVAIDSMTDMETLFNGIRLEDVSTSMASCASVFIPLAFYVALAKKQGADLKKITGTIHTDILKDYVTKGTYIYPIKHSMRIINDMLGWCSEVVPKWNIMCIPDHQIREAGGTAGVNKFKPDDIDEVSAFEIDDSIRRMQTEKLTIFRRQRDPAKCDSILQGLNDCAAGDENIMPAVMEAVENHCTLGEIADTLREVYGEYR